jgi:DnaJ family protein A protein 2
MKYHPDRNHGNLDCVSKFQKINEAYETLGDEQKKKEYDNINKNPFLNLSNTSDMDDILNALFSNSLFSMAGIPMGGMSMGGMNMGGMSMGGMPMREMPMREMNMGEMNMGGIPNIRSMKTSSFPSNSRFMPSGNVHIFHNGREVNFGNKLEKPQTIVKKITIDIEEVLTGATIPIEIERWIIENDNKVFENETLYIKIPKGIDENEIILMKEKGNIINDFNKGDIKIHVKINNKSEFKRSGLDLIMEKKICLKDALCGFSFEIKHINGKSYTLNNTSGNIILPGYKKIIPKMGLERDDHFGNMIVIFNVEFPEKLNKEQINKLSEIL